jgi:glycosyltransferase involved in cell wall biosynthesis
MDDLVSVVIPTYNRCALLVETIKSVIKQTYKNIEIIVVDDGSTDKTADIVPNLGYQQVRFYKLPHRGFPAPARNFGIREAHGKYVAMLDSDDLWKPRKIELQMKEFEAHPDLVLVSSDMEYMTKEKAQILNLRRNKQVFFHDLLKGNLILNSTVIFKKEVTKYVGFIDENPELKSVEDYDFWLRILEHRDGTSLILAKCYAKYRVHETNISAITRPLSLLIDLRKVLRIFKKYTPQGNEYLKRTLYKRLESARLNLYYLRLKAGAISLIDFFKYEKIKPISKVKGLFFFALNRMSKVIKILDPIGNKRVYI